MSFTIVTSMLIGSAFAASFVTIGIYIIQRRHHGRSVSLRRYLYVGVVSALFAALFWTMWFYVRYQVLTWEGLLSGLIWFVVVGGGGWSLSKIGKQPSP